MCYQKKWCCYFYNILSFINAFSCKGKDLFTQVVFIFFYLLCFVLFGAAGLDSPGQPRTWYGAKISLPLKILLSQPYMSWGERAGTTCLAVLISWYESFMMWICFHGGSVRAGERPSHVSLTRKRDLVDVRHQQCGCGCAGEVRLGTLSAHRPPGRRVSCRELPLHRIGSLAVRYPPTWVLPLVWRGGRGSGRWLSPSPRSNPPCLFW